ncbi:hypothetical protein ACNKHM_05205 [Shigella sonnei]
MAAAIDLSSGQPRRRYAFKTLWHHPLLVYTARLQPNAAGTTEQFAIHVPDIGHNGLRI